MYRQHTLVSAASRMTGATTCPRLIPLARMAVTSLSALIRPKISNAVASIAIGRENSGSFGVISSRKYPTTSRPTFWFTNMSLSCFRMRASSSTNVNTPIVKNSVMTACRVIYLARIFIRCEYD